MSWWKAGLVTFATALACLPAPATAQIDASGLWFVYEFEPFSGGSTEFLEKWVVNGTTLTIEDPVTSEVRLTGTFDPQTGAFDVPVPRECPFTNQFGIFFPCCATEKRTGIVDPTATSFEAQYNHTFYAPHFRCLSLTDSLTGSRCGNGVQDEGEGCDDGARTAGDGCDATCAVEACHVCTGSPSTCTPSADGTPCDDGDACTAGDACSAGACVTGSEDACGRCHRRRSPPAWTR